MDVTGVDLGLLSGLATAWLVLELIAFVIGLVVFVLVMLFLVIPAIRGRR